MFIIPTLIFILLVSIFIVTPLILLGCGKLFKASNLAFKNAVLTGILILFVGAIFEVLSLIFHIENTLLNIAFSIVSLVLTIWIVKKKFGTNILRAIGIYITSLIFMVIISAAVALPIRVFAIQAFKIPSGTMLETIQIGDHILVNKLVYKFTPPERGDIVVFKYPEDPNKDYIKRIVAVGGDVIEIKNKKLYVNNDLIDEKYVIHTDRRILGKEISSRDNFGPATVPENSYFVMGDNRDNSNDSRFWGFVESKDIKGKAFIIYWSWDKENKTQRVERIGKSL